MAARPGLLPSLAFACLLSCAVTCAPPANAQSEDVLAAARRQVGVTTYYDGSYRKLPYPGGDVPAERGVCTDVVIRALRTARGIDLQQQIHVDAAANPGSYRRITRRDPSIDHRRVPNQMAWFARQGYSLPVSRSTSSYLPGDVVAWDLGGGVLHIGIVSDALSAKGIPLIVHNIGRGVREEDLLFEYRIIGHYRVARSATPDR